MGFAPVVICEFTCKRKLNKTTSCLVRSRGLGLHSNHESSSIQSRINAVSSPPGFPIKICQMLMKPILNAAYQIDNQRSTSNMEIDIVTCYTAIGSGCCGTSSVTDTHLPSVDYTNLTSNPASLCFAGSHRLWSELSV